jgi:hypothetical protein
METNCKNCGAVLRDGLCEYCGSRYFYVNGERCRRVDVDYEKKMWLMKSLRYTYDPEMMMFEIRTCEGIQNMTLELVSSVSEKGLIDMLYGEQ